MGTVETLRMRKNKIRHASSLSETVGDELNAVSQATGVIAEWINALESRLHYKTIAGSP